MSQTLLAPNASFFISHRVVRQHPLHLFWLEEIVPTGGTS